jgi:hypothetical protein
VNAPRGATGARHRHRERAGRRRAVAACALLVAACAAASDEPAAVAPAGTAASRTAEDPALARTLRELAGCDSREQARAALVGDLKQRDLEYVGFDQVALGHCIDGVLAAWATARAAPDDAAASARLTAAVASFARVRRDLVFARCAGAASCLPDVR